MKIAFSLNALRREHRPVCLAAGFFDGVHRGHQRVIKKTIVYARKTGGVAWVMTFNTHPLKVLHPAAAPLLLTSTLHKLQLLAGLGVDGCVVVPFTKRLARQTPAEFIAKLVRAVPALRAMLIGKNWSFGHNGRGHAALLRRLGGYYGFQVKAIAPVRHQGTPVSSTRIRRAIAAGRLTEAAHMLGRRFTVLGTVKPGRRLGRTIGIPTANLDPHNEVLPLNGVYAVRARSGRKIQAGIVNLGFRPTLPTRRKTSLLELHLFDVCRNLYGKDIEVFFLKRLRAERAFKSIPQLVRQVRRDMEQARHWLARHPCKG